MRITTISESLKFKIQREPLQPTTLSTSTPCSDHLRRKNMQLISQSRSVISRDQVHTLTFLSSEVLAITQSMRLKSQRKLSFMRIFQSAELMLEKRDRWLPSHMSQLTGEMLNRIRSKIVLLSFITCILLRHLSSNSKNLGLCVETTLNSSQCLVSLSQTLTRTLK